MTAEIHPLRNEAEAGWILLVRSKISTYSVRSLRVSMILTALFLQESLLSLGMIKSVAMTLPMMTQLYQIIALADHELIGSPSPL